MNEKQIKLRDFRRAIEDFQAQRQELMYCDFRSWDAKIQTFEQFLKTTTIVGDEILRLASQSSDSGVNSLFTEHGGGMVSYSPPVELETRLAHIARLVLRTPAHRLLKLGLGLCRDVKYQGCLDYVRTNIAKEFFDTVETRLTRKLEDLQDQYHDEAALIPFSQTFIFATNVALATGGGDASITVNVTYNAGFELIERRLVELQAAVEKIAEEQQRTAVASEAYDLALNKKLGAIITAVQSRDMQAASGLWEEFIKTASVGTLGEAAGRIVDVVTLAFWIWNLSHGKNSNAGL